MSLSDALSALAGGPRCDACHRPRVACVCDRIDPDKLASPVEVLVLQHPRENDVLLGTAPLLGRALERCRIEVGLSWPNLASALGRQHVDQSRWAVLAARPTIEPEPPPGTVLRASPKAGRPTKPLDEIEGIVVLDGTWSQAKTLWWRNPWLLKLDVLTLTPREPSIYGKLRKEPRRNWVSTLEAVADVLPALAPEAERERAEASRAALRRLMRTMLQRIRDATRPPATVGARSSFEPSRCESPKFDSFD